MTTIRRFVFFVFALTGAVAFAASDRFSDPEALGRWITYYYVQPEPQVVGEAVRAASLQGFIKGGKSAPPFFGFIAGVMHKNPEVAQLLAERLASLPEIDQPVLVLGIWYSGHTATKPLLKTLLKSMPAHKEMIEGFLAKTPPRLLDLPLEQGPWVLDALWGYFMATGDDSPVVRIISALPWVNVRGDIPRLSVGGAAKWSLTSNAVQHERVLAICRAQLGSQPQEVAHVLKVVIESAESDLRGQRKP
jgi:hypothetical protein